MNKLAQKYPREIASILGKYPEDQARAATMPLLYLAQREDGYVSKQDMGEIAEILGVSPTDVASLVGFYTLFHDKVEGHFRIQVCNDLPCALRGADEFLDQLCENLGIRIGETTSDGQVTIEAVMCLAACDKAPMFQVQSPGEIRYYEDQTVETALELIRSLLQEG